MSVKQAQHSNFKTLLNAWYRQQLGLPAKLEITVSAMVVDSGATSHFMRLEENLPDHGPSHKIVSLLDGSRIKASHTTELPFPALSESAHHAHVLPNLIPNSLISIPKLADAGYTTVFHRHGGGVTIHAKKRFSFRQRFKPVLQGWRDKDGLWQLGHVDTKNISNKTETAANNHSLSSTAAAIKYLHAAAGYPVNETWIKAIKKGHYVSWPGLTVDAVYKHFPDAIEMHKGHMRKQRQNVCSTKQPRTTFAADEDKELDRALATQNIMVKVVNATNTIYTDQTGRLPVRSTRGNKLLMILFDINANYINAEPLIDNKDTSLITAYQALWK